MKRILLSFFVLIGGFCTAHAQSARFGIKAGGSLTSVVGKDVKATAASKLGFHGGVVANLGLTDRFSVQPELLYSMKGLRDELSSATGYQTLHYVDVPVLLKASFNAFFLEAGPQLGVLMSATQSIESGSMSNSVSSKAAFKDIDFGYALGLGVQATTGLMAGLRYNGGLSNIAKPVTLGGQTIQPEARNSALQIYVGYLFGVK
ncbi:porin family protein [Hymenobacter antarcticus]|uniref:Porin family protein n=1 Tax=Hymenobacter antarcticus TaxID=486270 RepID=A0ABP7QYC6_9BACT